MKKLPYTGIIGEDRLREAAAGSYQQVMELVEAGLRDLFQMSGEADPWPYVRALFPDSVVVSKKGKLYRYPYTIADDKSVSFGDAAQVEETFEPAGTTKPVTQGSFLEAVDGDDGARWRIRVIRAGLSGNRNYYPDAALKESTGLFEGLRVFVKSDDEHLGGKGKDVRNLIGGLSDVEFVEGKGKDTGEIRATLTMLEPQGTIATKLREAWSRGMTGLFGFSIDARGPVNRSSRGGVPVRVLKNFTRVNSVDLIVEPGAGGEVINLIESKKDSLMDRDEIIALIEAKRPELLKDKSVEDMSDDALKAVLTEALDGKPADEDDPDEGAGGTGATADGATRNDVDAAVKMVEARANMRERVNASKLPDKAKARLRQRFENEESFTEAQVDQAIKDEADYLATFTESGSVADLGDVSHIESGETRAEKVEQMLEAFFDPNHKDHKHAQSFRECYALITGDRRVTGILRNCDESLLRESLSSASFADVLGDSITRRMVADYRAGSVYDVWRQLATVTPINDFRTQERTRFGGYGDLPAVAESGSYDPLASPTDEKATYAISKRGGTEDITLEMIRNDDVGSIRRIPMKLSRAGQRTLGKFVLDFIATNPTIYDAVAFFHASHGNLGAAALDAASLAAGRLAMLKQAEAGSSDRLGIGPRNLWVPPDLEETGVDLFRRNTENDKTFAQSLALNVIPVWYWTDLNDWALTADPNDIPIVEIGFLDGNEEPELFVQDNPTVGSMFSNDKLTYKIRHIYGGAVVDFRGAYKAVVA